MKLYDLVKKLLETSVDYRDSDKKLMWAVWSQLGYIDDGGKLLGSNFLNKACPTPESITRCRRKIQEKHPELQASVGVQQERNRIEREKGTHIFREPAKPMTQYVQTGPNTMKIIDNSAIMKEAK